MPRIIPIKDLKDTASVSELCHSVKEPVYVTKNGYGDMVLMSMELFEETQSQLFLYKTLEQSEQDILEGKVRDAKEVVAELRDKYLND